MSLVNLKASVAGKIAAWLFAEAPAAVRNHLNISELVRIAFTALVAAGGAHGLGLDALVVQILGSVGTVFAPGDVVLATAVLTAIHEVLRRLDHGAPAATVLGYEAAILRNLGAPAPADLTLPPVPTKTLPEATAPDVPDFSMNRVG